MAGIKTFLAFYKNLWNKDLLKTAWNSASKNVEDGGNEFFAGLRNLWRGVTGSGLTDRDVALNQMNMQNVEDTASAQVAGYQKAGINPALMYGNGASNSAPQTTGSGVGNFSDLMQVITLPMQLRLMNAQASKTEADTQKTISETGQIKQIMEYYPSLTEHTIAEIISREGINLQNISKEKAQTDILEFEKIIKEAESKEASAFYKARREYEEAKDDESRASAAASAARAAWDSYEKDYTEKHNGAKPSSSSILALVQAISAFLGVNLEDAPEQVVNAILGAPKGNKKEPEYTGKWITAEDRAKGAYNAGSAGASRAFKMATRLAR